MGYFSVGAQALLDLLFPRPCPGCGNILLPAETALCLECLATLPRTSYGATPQQNPMFEALHESLGAVPPAQGAAAWLFFEAGGKLQRILHTLKYENRPQLAYQLGVFYGRELAGSGFPQVPAVLVPIPLHQRKQRQRGYNQSERFAAGIGAVTGLPVNTTLLQRTRFTDSQTGKNKTERQQNVAGAFTAPQTIQTPVVLVDDVVTTGATVRAATSALLQSGCPHIQVLAMAYVPTF